MLSVSLSPFSGGAAQPEVLPTAIACAHRHWARCQHRLNCKLQGEISGGTRASCPWPTRIPRHQALCITSSAQHLFRAMCYCAASVSCCLCCRYDSHFPDTLQEEKILPSSDWMCIWVPAAVPSVCSTHHVLTKRV